MKKGNKGGKSRFRKRVLRVRNELARHGGRKQSWGWAAKQASRIHNRRTAHASSFDKAGRKGWKR